MLKRYITHVTILTILAFLLGVAGWFGYCVTCYGQITLQWNSNREADLAGYKIYYGTSSGNYTHSVVVGLADHHWQSTTKYKLTRLKKNQRYYIAVTAFNLYGYESSFSNEVEGYAR